MMRLLSHLIYGMLWLLGLLIYKMPFFIKKNLAKGIALLWFYGFPFRVKTVLHNIALVFPRKSSESNNDFKARCYALARANLEHMCLSFLEVLERFHWKASDEGRRFVVEGRENFNFHYENPKAGIFCLTAHIGNWEMITWIGTMIKVRLTIVTRFLRNPFFDHLWRRSRYAFGLELLEESGSGLSIVRAVKRGRAIGFIFDQHTGEPHGIESKFLGLKAWSPKALAIICSKMEAPIIPTYVYRDLEGMSHVVIEAPMNFRAESKSEDIGYHVQQCNDRIGDWVYRHPEQYLWMHRRFKNFFDYRQALPWS